MVVVAHRGDGAVTADSVAARAMTELLEIVRQAEAQELRRRGRTVARLATNWLMGLENGDEDEVEFGVITPGDGGIAVFLHGGVTAVLAGRERSEVLRGREAGFTVDRVVAPAPGIGAGLFVDEVGREVEMLPARGVFALGAGTAPGAGVVLWFDAADPEFAGQDAARGGASVQAVSDARPAFEPWRESAPQDAFDPRRMSDVQRRSDVRHESAPERGSDLQREADLQHASDPERGAELPRTSDSALWSDPQRTSDPKYGPEPQREPEREPGSDLQRGSDPQPAADLWNRDESLDAATENYSTSPIWREPVADLAASTSGKQEHSGASAHAAPEPARYLDVAVPEAAGSPGDDPSSLAQQPSRAARYPEAAESGRSGALGDESSPHVGNASRATHYPDRSRTGALDEDSSPHAREFSHAAQFTEASESERTGALGGEPSPLAGESSSGRRFQDSALPVGAELRQENASPRATEPTIAPRFLSSAVPDHAGSLREESSSHAEEPVSGRQLDDPVVSANAAAAYDDSFPRTREPVSTPRFPGSALPQRTPAPNDDSSSPARRPPSTPHFPGTVEPASSWPGSEESSSVAGESSSVPNDLGVAMPRRTGAVGEDSRYPGLAAHANTESLYEDSSPQVGEPASGPGFFGGAVPARSESLFEGSPPVGVTPSHGSVTPPRSHHPHNSSGDEGPTGDLSSDAGELAPRFSDEGPSGDLSSDVGGLAPRSSGGAVLGDAEQLYGGPPAISVTPPRGPVVPPRSHDSYGAADAEGLADESSPMGAPPHPLDASGANTEWPSQESPFASSRPPQVAMPANLRKFAAADQHGYSGEQPGVAQYESQAQDHGRGSDVDFQETMISAEGLVARVVDSAPIPEIPHGVVVKGFKCARDHLNDPRVSFCAVCGIRMDQLTCILTDGVRPPLGLLLLDDGTSFVLDNDCVLGREPEHAEAVARGAHPVRLEDASGGMSRAHAEIRLIDWDVTVVDGGSTNGTHIRQPGHQDWTRAIPGHPIKLTPGAQVQLGGRVVTFDSQHGQL